MVNPSHEDSRVMGGKETGKNLPLENKAREWKKNAEYILQNTNILEEDTRSAFNYVCNIVNGESVDIEALTERIDVISQAAANFVSVNKELSSALGKFASASNNFRKDFINFRNYIRKIAESRSSGSSGTKTDKGQSAARQDSETKNILKEAKRLCDSRMYYSALSLLDRIKGGDEEFISLKESVSNEIDKVKRMISMAEYKHDVVERIDLYTRILSHCPDCKDAEKRLKSIYPPAPEKLNARIAGKNIHIEWSKLQSQCIRYILIRKKNGVPTNPSDGEIVCETSRNEAVDNAVDTGVGYYYAVYSKCGDNYSPKAAATSFPLMTVEELASEEILQEIYETRVGFEFKIPERAKCIEIYRDGALIKSVAGLSYVDTNLTPDYPYSYKFVVVYEDCAKREHRSTGTTIVVKPTAPPKPVSLVVAERNDVAELSWKKPESGVLCIYFSEKAFDVTENSLFKTGSLRCQSLDVAGTSCQIKKDFCGVMYYLPVTIKGDVCVAGKQIRLVSVVSPQGVRFDRNEKFVAVNWKWDHISSVRIQVQVDNGICQKYDIGYLAPPQYKVELPPKADVVKISISTILRVGKEFFVGEEISTVLRLKKIKIDFCEVKDESMFGLFSKDKYSLTIQSDSPVPGNLELLISENFSPTNLVDYKSHMTITPNELSPRKVLKKEFKYSRKQKGVPVFFRLIVADRELAKQVIIIPETRQLK